MATKSTENGKNQVPGKSAEADMHSGHRARMRDRYLCTGLDGFAPHEIMEFLLTYSIRRRDVNGPAHALIDRFGSVAGVLDASPEELCEVGGIGPDTALYLKLLMDICRRYSLDKCQSMTEAMDTEAKIKEYLQALYIGERKEKVYLLLFDNSMRLLDCSCVGEGSVNDVQADFRKIIELALFKHASAAVIAHNHPNGLAIPSAEDRRLTDEVIGILELIRVPLLEHMLVTDSLCVSILRKSRGVLRSAPCNGIRNEEFWNHFYGLTDEPEPIEGSSS